MSGGGAGRSCHLSQIWRVCVAAALRVLAKYLLTGNLGRILPRLRERGGGGGSQPQRADVPRHFQHGDLLAPHGLAPAVDLQRAGVGGLRRCSTRARPWPSHGGEGLRGAAYGMFCVLFSHTWSPMHWPGPMVPELCAQAETPIQASFPMLAPVLPAQAWSPTQALAPTAPVLLWHAKSPSQAPSPMGPELPLQAPFPTQASCPTAPLLPPQARNPWQASLPMRAPVLSEQALDPTQASFPIVPLLMRQAKSSTQAWFPTAPVLLLQALFPTQASFPMAPVLKEQAKNPSQASLLMAPLLFRQASIPTQASFPMGPVLFRQASIPIQEFCPTVCAPVGAGNSRGPRASPRANKTPARPRPPRRRRSTMGVRRARAANRSRQVSVLSMRSSSMS